MGFTALRTAGRYWHTARHLYPSQLYGRLWFQLYRPSIDDSPAPLLRERCGAWTMPAERGASMLEPNTFRFLNRRGSLLSAADWNASGQDKLWLYNLHYFDDLNAEGCAARRDWHRSLLSRWIEENPPGKGNGWESYPLSLRIVNWIKWALAGNILGEAAIQSLAVQARFLARRLEWHLLGNHLFANAKALIFAGAFFKGEEADAWRQTGLRILSRQLPEQVLADGGHFELSPMYHSLVEEDLLDLVNLAQAYPGTVPQEIVAAWRERAQSMRGWLAAMSHPDGGIAFFNDAAHGVAPSPAALEAYAQRLGLPPCPGPQDGVTHLAQSGFIRVQQGDFIALLDVGCLGPDYLPGHAHADTLSFELSISGKRVFVNSGTSRYAAGPERNRERATAAHNTVEVDGENSSDVWGSFRVARRARPFGLEIETQRDAVTVACAHDGYGWLPGKVVHRRKWRFKPGSLAIEDRVEGGPAEAKSLLHLHPDVRILPEEGRLLLEGGLGLRYEIENGRLAVADYSYHPEFGLSRPARCLEIALLTSSSAARFSLV
jgi:uncharacterized heparinase superfamily protein